MLWINFFISVLYALELAMKSYAYGIRRAYSQANWVLKVEFYYQPIIWTMFFIFLTNYAGDHGLEVNFFSLGILIRSLRMTSVLNEVTLWRNFMRTMRALVKPAFSFAITLYSLYLIYASIGLEFFGGRINSQEIARLMLEYP